MKVAIRVPASTSNLGPGFDVLGMALSLYNDVEVTARDDGVVEIVAAPTDDPLLNDVATNMVAQGWLAQCTASRVPADAHGASITSVNRIPLARGLGSSASAALAGVLAANAVHKLNLTQAAMLATVVALEGHPDNAAASLYGGLVVCASAVTRVALAPGLALVVVVPEIRVRTADARSVVPATYARADAVYNLGRCATLVHALESGEFALLGDAMADRWHQPQRTVLVPFLNDVIANARSAGAYGAALSGAGPSIIALTPPDNAVDVGDAMVETVRGHHVAATALELAVDTDGAQVTIH